MLGRIATGPKVFLILGIALLPLAIIAAAASLRTTQTADDIAAAQLRVAINESGRKLANELIGDMTALRATLSALDADPADVPSCARAQGVFAQQAANGTIFSIIDAQGRAECGRLLPEEVRAAAPAPGQPMAARLIPGRGLTLSIASANGMTFASAFFPISFLVKTAHPTGLALAHGQALLGDEQTLILADPAAAGPIELRARQVVALGIDDLRLQMSVPRVPLSRPALLAMLVPILMWIAAALIGWLVVDALLIRPLQRLRRRVAAFEPGDVFDAGIMRRAHAQEIRELGETFRRLSQIVASHEAGLAEGLVRQTRLTREVHHRVKNNLQVISSLINFHARGARSAEATEAYASIQRRVDALAVVHRYHFAEMEENRGISLRSVIGELAANIRATAPEASSRLAIGIDIDPVLATQDTATAVAFLITELVEFAMTLHPAAQIRLSMKPGDDDRRAILRVSSPAYIDSDALNTAIAERYGRVIDGLSRQLRSKLHHDPLVGVYEIAVTVTGHE
ncbi:MAG: histidine kinase [Pseudomonadota bacterium]|nr:histidine kinase [Pseudomonadota bacterium]